MPEKKSGFTLVELANVLVIIGLLIGGILVAQSMIETAKIVGFIKEYQQLEVAGQNFYTKFGQLPGDCSTCSSLGETGNGDGVISMSDGNSNGEGGQFWIMLQNAGMLPAPATGSYGGALSSDLQFQGGVNAYQLKSFNDPNSLIYLSYANYNNPSNDRLFMLSSTNGNTFSVGYASTNWNAAFFTGRQALAIDAKIDDGNPVTGIVGGEDSYAKNTQTWPGCFGPQWPFNMPASGNSYYNDDQHSCILQIRVFIDLVGP